MELFKILGAILVALGMAFRAICVAYFATHRPLDGDASKLRRYEASKRRALLIDIGFFAAGIALFFGR